MEDKRVMKLREIIRGVIREEIEGLNNIDMNSETISSLYTKFHKWATNRSVALPPVPAAQFIKGMTVVGNEVKKNPSVSGEGAIRIILKALEDGKFTSGAQPIPYLIKKYGKSTVGKLSPRGYIL